MKKGFTLIELAIVIVIIGLIVGGVLGAQSLIRSAELNTIMTDVAKYKTAIKAFELEYDALPGDFDEASTYWPADCVDDAESTCDGDGDKRIGRVVAGASPKPREERRVWQHLSLAEIISGGYDGGNPYNTVDAANTTIPSGPRSGVYQFLWEELNYLVSTPYNTGAYIVFGKWVDAYGYQDSWGGSIVTPGEARKIDNKIDDGQPREGVVQNYTGTDDYSGCYSSHNLPSEYSLSVTEQDCWMFFFVQK